MEADPQLDRFQLAQGHTGARRQLGSSDLNAHPRRGPGVRGAARRATAARFAANGAPYSFKGLLRPPFLSVNAATTVALAAMGSRRHAKPDLGDGN